MTAAYTFHYNLFLIIKLQEVEGMAGPEATESGFQFSEPNNMPSNGFNF